MPEPPWWKTAVIYQIYPRSFADSSPSTWADGGEAYRAKYPSESPVDANGDGVGDLPGLLRRLDHLAWLGVDAVWLSPFFRSPMKDFGYDVSDYCDVDPLFGTLADFDALVAAAHERGMRVVIDWVPNHSSSEHPWFVASRSARSDPKRDWYVWRDPAPDGGPPNNWRAAFGEDTRAWTFDEATGQWYLHLFLPEQPDLSWANPAVEAAMHDTLRFWLDRGVDGFRMDVIHAIGKDPDLPDTPPELLPTPQSSLNDVPETHPLLRRIRSLLDSYPGDRMAVGEVYLLSTATVAQYYGADDELHLSFNFPPLYALWEASAWRECIERVQQELDPIGAWPTWVLSNHDNVRHRTRYGSEARARAAAVLLLTLRGTPFLYAGEELGLEDAVIPPDRVVDPGGRDGCRAPIPWQRQAPHGWEGAEPWLPWPPSPGERSVEAQREDPSSMLHLYRRLLAARHASPALQVGALTLLDTPEGVLGYTRTDGDDHRTVLVSYAAAPTVVALSGTVEVASDGVGEGAPFSGTLAPDQAVVLH